MELSVYYLLSATLVQLPLLHLLVKAYVVLLARALGILKLSLDECTELLFEV